MIRAVLPKHLDRKTNFKGRLATHVILLLTAVLPVSGCSKPHKPDDALGKRNTSTEPDDTLCKPDDPARYWEKFPSPPGRSSGLSAIGFDHGGGLWVMSGTGTYFWNSREKKWNDSALTSGQYLTQFYGRAKTDLYATQRGKEEHVGEVYRLDDGRATFVTNIYYDVAHDSPGFYVSNDGRLFNWGENKLRVYAHDQWIERSTSLPQFGLMVLDDGDNVALYSKGHLYLVDKSNTLSEIDVDAAINRRANRGTVWGQGKTILLEYGAPGVSGFDVRTGRPADTTNINLTLAKRPLYDLTSTPDGSVWIMAYDRELSSYVLFRVLPDGTTTLVRATAGLPWDNTQFASSPQSVLMDRHGAVWFASNKVGVFYLYHDEIHQFDARVDNSPRICGRLIQDSEGNVYAGAGEEGLYVFNNGKSVTGQPSPEAIPISSPGDSEWSRGLPSNDRLKMAWQVGQLILFTTQNGKELVALDATSGSIRFALPITKDDTASAWVSAGDDPEKVTVCLKDRIVSVDAQNGDILATLKCTHDQRIAPVRSGDDFILVGQYRGTNIKRITSTGQDVWNYELSGYVMTHPSAFGRVLLVQTRQGSYGGQATCAIDLATGKKLWEDVVNAYGAGTAFGDDAQYCVEADSFLAPKTTEAWLIARNPKTGERLWHYRKPGSTVEHAPLIDMVTNRVYGVFRDGTIVCLNGANGEKVWEIMLPTPPAKAPPASYDPYYSCASLAHGMLAVATEDQFLYLINPADGSIGRRVAMTEDIIKNGKRAGSDRLVAGPWLSGSLLIVPTETGISALKVSGLVGN